MTSFWSTLFNSAKSGALFLYDDNGKDIFNDYFDTKWKEAGLELIESETNILWTPSYTEKVSELAEYKSKFGENPKLKGYLSYRVLRKP